MVQLKATGLHRLLSKGICFSRLICLTSAATRCLIPSIFVLAAGGNMHGAKYTGAYIRKHTQAAEQVCFDFIRDRIELNCYRSS